MGTIVAVKYVTLVLGHLEIQFYEKCRNEFDVNNRKSSDEDWQGFLDDCYITLDATNINSLRLLIYLISLMTILNLQGKNTTSIFHFLIS